MRVLIQLRGLILTAGFGLLVAATPARIGVALADDAASGDATLGQAASSNSTSSPNSAGASGESSSGDSTDTAVSSTGASDDSTDGADVSKSSDSSIGSEDQASNGLKASGGASSDPLPEPSEPSNDSGDTEEFARIVGNASPESNEDVSSPSEQDDGDVVVDVASGSSSDSQGVVSAASTASAQVEVASTRQVGDDDGGDVDSGELEEGEGREESAAAQAAQAGLVTPSGLQIVVSTSVQAGLQTDETTHHAQASLSISANYKLHEKVFISGRLSPYVELTRMPNDNRRTGFSGNGNTVRLNFRNLVHEKFTDIRLGGSLGYVLPIGYNDIFLGNPRAGTVTGAVQLFRGIGPVMLVGSLGANLPLYFNQRAKLQCDPEKVKEVGASCPSHPWGNSYNSAFSLSSSLLAIYSVGSFSFSGSLQVGTGWTWGPSSANEPYNTNDHANRRFSQGFSFQGAYAINRSWSVNAGFYNSGPQITGEWGRRNPFFNKDFAAVYIGADWVH